MIAHAEGNEYFEMGYSSSVNLKTIRMMERCKLPNVGPHLYLAGFATFSIEFDSG